MLAEGRGVDVAVTSEIYKAAFRHCGALIGCSYRSATAVALSIGICACGGDGGGPASYRISGSISGLAASGLQLSDGTVTVRPAAGATSFVFSNPVPAGSSYVVSFIAFPTGQTCSLSNPTGRVTGNGANVQVTCTTIPTFSVGGTISGLTGGGLILSDQMVSGGAPGVVPQSVTYTLSPAAGATSFTFQGKLGSAIEYGVSVQTQPANQQCQVTNPEGLIGNAAVTNVAVGCVSGQWTWESGSSSPAPPEYGTQGVAASSNAPGDRFNAASWVDSSGNFWLFGGDNGYAAQTNAGAPQVLGDLWKYDPATNQWTWVGGSNSTGAPAVYGAQGVPAAGNYPGARQLMESWTDLSGNFWLFGGSGLNDLWEYNPNTNLWTWISGSAAPPASAFYGTLGVFSPTNVPGARIGANTWVDHSGNLWLFGGSGLNDLWEFKPATNQWAWMGGSSTPGVSGVYGTSGVPASANVPGSRTYASSWTDSAGNFWLFGGIGVSFLLDDLWEYNPATGLWTWFGPATSNPEYAPILGVGNPSNTPPPRSDAASWADHSGNLWMFGGDGNVSAMNDLWKYNIALGEWTWMGGPQLGLSAGAVFGTEGVGAATNLPGRLLDAVTWTDGSGNLWLFGGQIGGSALWKYVP